MTVSRAAALTLLPFVLAACSGRADPVASRATAQADGQASASTPALERVELGAGFGVLGDGVDAFFTDPTSPLADQLTGGIDGPLIELLDSARLSIDVAAYRLQSDAIRRALLRAVDRGVRVRIVLEEDDLDSPDVRALLAAGVPIVTDGPDSLMHNKFAVIDGAVVWTGSVNFTTSGIYQDDNNALRVDSRELAAMYTTEFEEMFVSRHFGLLSLASAPSPSLTLEGAIIEVYFAPDMRVAARIEELIRSAHESVYFMAFSFTSDGLGAAIRDQARRGIQVRGVMDADQVRSNQGGEYDAFRLAGLQVRTDLLEGQMHHKVLIIDERVVVTGSYNFTGSAEHRNDENALVIADPRLAAVFLGEFEALYAQSSR